MTNYEMILTRFGGDPAKLAKEAKALYQKRRHAHTSLLIGPLEDTFEKWIFAEADIALVYDVDDLVEFTDQAKNPEDGVVYETVKYGIVKSYWQNNMRECPLEGQGREAPPQGGDRPRLRLPQEGHARRRRARGGALRLRRHARARQHVRKRSALRGHGQVHPRL